MPRLKGRTKPATRQMILGAAVKTFGEVGHGRVSLARIAEAAGVSAAALCQHFGDKEQLYEAASEEVYRGLVAGLDRLDPQLPLPELIEKMYAHAEASRVGVRLLLRRNLEAGGVEARTKARHVAPLLAAASERVAEIYEVPPRRARETLVALGHLVAHFVTNAPADNAAAFGVDRPDEARVRIVQLLTTIARQLLGAG
jgi:AcrR family transcriptional regulator